MSVISLTLNLQLKFILKNTLNQNMNPCEQCGYQATQQSNLKKYIKTKHKQ